MDLEQQLHAALAPCKPGPTLRAAVLAQVSTNARPGSGAKARPRWPILAGGLLVLAAAAAMLAIHGKSAPPVPVVMAAAVPAIAAAPAPTPASAPAPAPIVAPPDAVQKESASEVKPFMVRVDLTDKTTDESARAAVAAFHAAFLERLHLIPGLNLAESDATACAGAARRPYYCIKITTIGQKNGRQFLANIIATPSSDVVPPRMALPEITGDIAPACTGPAAADPSLLLVRASPCADPATMAAVLVTSLRKGFFPADASLPRQLQAQLRDRRLDANERLQALETFMSVRQQQAGQRTASGAGTVEQVDADFVHGVADLATTATDPALRAQVWRMARGLRSPQLVQPLMVTLRQEPDDEARLEAVSTLVTDFNGDARVRTALQTVAQEDPRPLVRAVAQRGLTGDAAWHGYIVASLKDESRSDAERIEALVYDAIDRMPPLPDADYLSKALLRYEPIEDRWAGIPELLDDAAIRALVEVLPRLQSTPQLTRPMLVQLATNVASIDHPAIVELLLDNVTAQSGPMPDTLAIPGLLRHGDDPRVLAAIRKNQNPRVRQLLQLYSTDPDNPKRRQTAIRALEPVTAPAAQ